MKPVVLVTAIGTAASTTIIKELSKTGKYHIIGADMAERNQVATSLDVAEYYQFPPSIGEEYIPFALNFCREHQVEYYFAIIDDEVVNLAKNRERFLRFGTKLCIPDYEFVAKCHYKDAFLDWISKSAPEIAIKQYTNFEDLKTAEYPLFTKPSEGAASRGCKRVDSYEELISTVSASDLGKTVLVQDFVKGDFITVDCISNRKTGQRQLIPRKECLRNTDGCGIAVEIFYDHELETICFSLLDELDLNGVVNIEFFHTETGYKIVEINPRHSAGTVYSCMAGGDTVLNAIRIVDGAPCVFGDVEFGAHFAKRYEAYRMD